MTGTCQHERRYTLPSGNNGFVRCREPASERSHVELMFTIIEWLCPKHDANTEPYVERKRQ